MSEAVFVLVHSPLVGPMTWEPVAERLVREGHDVLVPRLSRPAGVRRPYSLQYALEVAGAASLVPPGKPIVLVGHSNAGQRLASFRQEIAAPVAAYVLVDSALPERTLSEEGRSYLVQRRRQAVEGMIEPWTEDELAPALPDPVLRRRFVAEITAWPLAFFEEEIPVFVGWPDVPCAYIRFTANYRAATERAIREGWPLIEFDGADHFHMLVDPEAVADSLLEASRRLLI